MADDYVEMWQGLSDSKFAPAEPRTSDTTTLTSWSEFVREQMLPRLNELATA